MIHFIIFFTVEEAEEKELQLYCSESGTGIVYFAILSRILENGGNELKLVN